MVVGGVVVVDARDEVDAAAVLNLQTGQGLLAEVSHVDDGRRRRVSCCQSWNEKRTSTLSVPATTGSQSPCAGSSVLKVSEYDPSGAR